MYQIRHTARSQAGGPMSAPAAGGAGVLTLLEQRSPGAKEPAPQPRLGQGGSMPRHRRESGTYRHQWLFISLLLPVMVKAEGDLVSSGRSWSCLGRRENLNAQLEQSILLGSLDAFSSRSLGPAGSPVTEATPGSPEPFGFPCPHLPGHALLEPRFVVLPYTIPGPRIGPGTHLGHALGCAPRLGHAPHHVLCCAPRLGHALCRAPRLGHAPCLRHALCHAPPLGHADSSHACAHTCAGRGAALTSLSAQTPSQHTLT